MKWTPVESSALQAAATPRARLCCTCCSTAARSIATSMFLSGSIKSFWRRIPKADTSGVIFVGASVTSECAGRDGDSLGRKISRD